MFCEVCFAYQESRLVLAVPGVQVVPLDQAHQEIRSLPSFQVHQEDLNSEKVLFY